MEFTRRVQAVLSQITAGYPFKYRTIPAGWPLALIVASLMPLIGITASPKAQINELAAPHDTIPSSFFGMHFHNLVGSNGKNPSTQWPAVTIPEWRLWDAHVTWPDMEPAKGRWRFDTLDKSVTIAQEHQTEMMLTLGFTPAWASARPQERVGYNPGWAAEPTELDDWRSFVQTVATRYKGRIHIYEIWNEPNLKKDFWTGSIEQLVQLEHAAHDIIKSIDPMATVVSPSVAGEYGISWFSEFLNKGGGQFVDVIGYHFYVSPNPPEAMVPFVGKVKQVMLAHGLDQKPLWNTESGWKPSTPPLPEDMGAAYLARSYILLWAAGVQRFYWYAWDNRDASVVGMRPDNTLTPAGKAFGVIQNWLVGARMDGCDEDTNHTWTCQLHRNGKLQWIVWNPDSNRPFTAPRSWRAKSITPLLEQSRILNGSTFDVGSMPILVNGPVP